MILSTKPIAFAKCSVDGPWCQVMIFFFATWMIRIQAKKIVSLLARLKYIYLPSLDFALMEAFYVGVYFAFLIGLWS